MTGSSHSDLTLRRAHLSHIVHVVVGGCVEQSLRQIARGRHFHEHVLAFKEVLDAMFGGFICNISQGMRAMTTNGRQLGNCKMPYQGSSRGWQ
eukprot:767039-Hanusia_phi.AAC.4